MGGAREKTLNIRLSHSGHTKRGFDMANIRNRNGKWQAQGRIQGQAPGFPPMAESLNASLDFEKVGMGYLYAPGEFHV